MPLFTYTYALSDFPTGEVNVSQFVEEVRSCEEITVALHGVAVSQDVQVTFRAELSQDEKTALDGIVASHEPEPEERSENWIVIDASTDRRVTGKVEYDRASGGTFIPPTVSELPQGGTPGELVVHLGDGAAYRFDGATWASLRARPTVHAESHAAGGEDEVQHDLLAGAGQRTHAELDAHLSDTSNPHGVTKGQVGLGAVLNAAQLKRDAGDFYSFPAVVSLTDSDVALFEVGSAHDKSFCTFLDLAKSVLRRVRPIWHAEKMWPAVNPRPTLRRYLEKAFVLSDSCSVYLRISYRWSAFSLRGGRRARRVATFVGAVRLDGRTVHEHISPAPFGVHGKTRLWHEWTGRAVLSPGEHTVSIWWAPDGDWASAEIGDAQITIEAIVEGEE